jgi:hypothetical protein
MFCEATLVEEGFHDVGFLSEDLFPSKGLKALLRVLPDTSTRSIRPLSL